MRQWPLTPSQREARFGGNLLGISVAKGPGALKGLTPSQQEARFFGATYLELV